MRTATIILSLCTLVCASGCSFIDDFGSFTVAAGDASTADLGHDGGTPSDLGSDALAPDLGDRDLGGPDLGAPDAGPIGSVVDIVAGSGHTCALFTSGRLRCWGANDYGELGNADDFAGVGGTDQAMPQDVVGLPGPVLQVAAGYGHTCAIVDELGTNVLFCWGDGGDGQHGNGSRDIYVSTPRRVVTTWQPAAVAAGGDFTCVIDTDFRVLCAGANADGQLGTPNSTTSLSDTFIETSMSLAARSPSAIIAGWNNACVIGDGNEVCWGSGDSQQLMRLATDDSADAVEVIAASQIAIGTSHICGLTALGAVQCWGYGAWGQLGVGTEVNSYMPVTVLGPEAAGVPIRANAVVAADNHTCAIYEDATGGDDVYCWGHNDAAELGVAAVPPNEWLTLPRKVEGIDAVTKLTSGDDHVCALTMAGDVYCWGSNWYLSLGPGGRADFGDSPTPVRVTGLD